VNRFPLTVKFYEAHVNEAILTEKVYLSAESKDTLIGRSILESGTVRAQVTATGDDTILAGILNLVKKHREKPPVQHMADRIMRSLFRVIVIAFLTLAINWCIWELTPALMPVLRYW
jgi:Cu+-exporting ATPase